MVKIKKQQGEVIQNIAAKLGKNAVDSLENNLFGIKITNGTNPDIVIHNDITLQRISFGEQILFETQKAILKSQGEEVIRKVGLGIKTKLNYIEKIIIQVHTDNVGKTQDNMRLGAERGMSVFNYLTEKVKINPSEHLMSITSFGEYN